MRLTIDHRTSYRFDRPQKRLVQLLRMTPDDTHDQTVASWRIDVDCDARLRTKRDGFGNIVTMLYANGPIDGIEIAVTGEVLTSDTPGVLRGALDPLPPAVFCRTTPATAANAALTRFATKVAGKLPEAEALQAINVALHERFRIMNRRGDLSHVAAETFVAEDASPRGMAQMMVACARSRGTPARFVTGYCGSGFGGATRPTPHSWAEAWLEDVGWMSFDPCLGLPADEAYVRVAIGLDATGAAPVAGVRLGPGREEMEAAVSVDTVEE